MLAHDVAGPVAVALTDGLVDGVVLGQDLLEALRAIGHQRLAVHLHADMDVLAQGAHRGFEILVVGRACHGQVKGEIRILAVDVRARGRAQELQRFFHLREGGSVAPLGGEARRIGLDRQAEFVAALDVGDGFHAGETQRRLLLRRPHEIARPLARIDQPLAAQPLQRRAQHGA